MKHLKKNNLIVKHLKFIDIGISGTMGIYILKK